MIERSSCCEPPSIDVLVFDGCPHALPALELAGAVAARLGPGITVRRVEVATPEQAAAQGFLGSPSFRVGGRDIEGRSTTEGTLCCRTYAEGSGLPPAWQLEVAVLRALDPRGLLFLCVANSARSQLAEGLARSLAPAGVEVWSAGSKPTRVHAEVSATLREVGLDSSRLRSKAVAEIPAERVDTVITLCGAEECPVFLGNARRLHWPLPDPASPTLADTADAGAAFRELRDDLLRRLRNLWVAE